MEVHNADAEEIGEDADLVDYNSVMDWKKESSVNFDVDWYLGKAKEEGVHYYLYNKF